MNIQGVSLANGVPKMPLVCPKCDIVKTDMDEMEVHVKVEHLGWLPFQCPICSTTRASDGQMREHIFSGHGMINVNQYVYLDNIEAKRELVVLLNQALFRGVKEKENTEQEERVEEHPADAMPTLVKQETESVVSSPQKDDSSGPANLMALLGEIGGNNLEMEGEEAEEMASVPPVDIMEMFNAQMAMKNVAALFHAVTPNESKKKVTRGAASGKAGTPCNACKSFVSFRSRTPHVYGHLLKDHNEPRFRCRWGDCIFAVPRKDLLEAHMMKSHGVNSPEFFEDRTADISQLFKTVSKELFYQHTNSHPPDEPDTDGGSPSTTPTKAMETNGIEDNETAEANLPIVTKGKRKSTAKEFFKCEKCDSNHSAEDRVSHVQFHLYTDNGVIRYSCRLCDFKHQMQQQIIQHGTQRHGVDEDVLVDSLNQYMDTLDEISMAYFGEPYDALNKNLKKNRKRLLSINDYHGGGDTEDEGSQMDEGVHQGQTNHTRPRSESEADVKPTAEQRINMAKSIEKTRLAEISRLFGGSHYLNRSGGQAAMCQICKTSRKSGLAEHAYIHMKKAPFGCPLCEFKSASRKSVVGHMRDRHAESDALPVDKRLRYAAELKETMRICYGDIFMDAPLPTNHDLENFTRGAGELLRADEQVGGDA